MKYLFVLLFLLKNACLFSQEIQRPKLVVGLVLDQMRWDYIYRYYNNYGEAGFRRLLKTGYAYENAFIPYTPSVTAAGHASIYTGAVPAIHGIVGNEWVDRKTGEYRYCTDDPNSSGVGSDLKEGMMSPVNLMATTIGDELKLATNQRSRVFGIALKDRGGILAAGRSADAAYWLSDQSGNWISSNWYMKDLPEWVKKYNGKRKQDSLIMKVWNPVKPLKDYLQSDADSNTYEMILTHEKSPAFPHQFKGNPEGNYYTLRTSPFGNSFTLDFAKEVISREKLGQTGNTDMLCISLSSADYLGHRFGPASVEIEDMYIRLDKELGEFFTNLDKIYGKDGYLLFLSADHGAPHIPAYLAEKQISAGNVNGYAMVAEINDMLEKRFGTGGLVSHYLEYQYFLNNERIDSFKVSRQELINVLVKYISKKPGVKLVFPYDKFHEQILPAEVKEMYVRGYNKKRSGDLQVILETQYTDYLDKGTEHGSPYNYDTHIPLIWMGWNIKPGKSYRKVSMTDIAPTLSALLKVQQPNGASGEVLLEIME